MQLKSGITGTYRAIRDKHVPRYLAEFEYRFNRRYDLAAMMPRLGYVAVRTSPMPLMRNQEERNPLRTGIRDMPGEPRAKPGP